MPRNEELVLDENHVYRLIPSGRIIPGVSEIIQSVFPFNGKGLAVDRASDFGTALHTAIDLEIKGKLNWATVDEPLLPYIKQWHNVLSTKDILTIRCQTEVKLASKKYLFAGKIDCVEKTIFDWKSGQKSPTHRYQISAYRHLWNINNPKDKKDKGIIVYLDGSEKEPEIVEEQKSDFSVFLACLEIWKAKQKENIK